MIKSLLREVMRLIKIIVYVLSKYAVQNNNLEDYIGELEKIIEVLPVQVFTVPSIQPFPLKNILNLRMYLSVINYNL